MWRTGISVELTFPLPACMWLMRYLGLVQSPTDYVSLAWSYWYCGPAWCPMQRKGSRCPYDVCFDREEESWHSSEARLKRCPCHCWERKSAMVPKYPCSLFLGVPRTQSSRPVYTKAIFQGYDCSEQPGGMRQLSSPRPRRPTIKAADSL